MKALQLVRASAASLPTLSLVIVPVPSLKPNHLLVRIHASPIHPSDVMNASGNFPYTSFPRIPGRDFAGIAVDGPPSHPFLGMEVFGSSGYTYAFSQDGFHAEYALVHKDSLALKPKNLKSAKAATLGVPFTTAGLALRRADARRGDFVLVIGAHGAVGSAVTQLARAKGCRVITVSRFDPRDISILKDPELFGVTALTENRGVDVVIDTTGLPELLRAAMGRLAPGGRAVFMTAPKNGACTEFSFEMRDFYREEKSLIGVNSLRYSANTMAKELIAMVPLFESDEVKVKADDVWEEVKLDDAVQAYEKAKQKATAKFVVVM
jgi:NADPH2:quinone reductase